MTMPPPWLPPMLNLDGVWDRNLNRLFAIFTNDFITNRPMLDSFLVWYDRTIKEGSYPEGFWHVITKKDNGVRYPDFRRAERLPWCGPSIRNSGDPAIKKWDIFEEGEIRTYIWLENYDYVIVFAKRLHRIGEVRFLKTAYHVDGNSTRKKLREKFAKRLI